MRTREEKIEELRRKLDRATARFAAANAKIRTAQLQRERARRAMASVSRRLVALTQSECGHDKPFIQEQHNA